MPTVAEFFDTALSKRLKQKEINHLVEVANQSTFEKADLAVKNLILNASLHNNYINCLRALVRISDEANDPKIRAIASKGAVSFIRYLTEGEKQVKFDLDLNNPDAGSELLTIGIPPDLVTAKLLLSEIEKIRINKMRLYPMIVDQMSILLDEIKNGNSLKIEDKDALISQMQEIIKPSKIRSITFSQALRHLFNRGINGVRSSFVPNPT